MRTRLARFGRKAAATSLAILGTVVPLVVAVVVGLIFLDRPITPPENDTVVRAVAIVAAVTMLAAADSVTAPAFGSLRNRLTGRWLVPCPACHAPRPASVDVDQDGRAKR